MIIVQCIMVIWSFKNIFSKLLLSTEVMRVKNRFANPTPSGLTDVFINLRFTGRLGTWYYSNRSYQNLRPNIILSFGNLTDPLDQCVVGAWFAHAMRGHPFSEVSDSSGHLFSEGLSLISRGQGDKSSDGAWAMRSTTDWTRSGGQWGWYDISLWLSWYR